ncbi:MAG: hypothetical protein ACREIA_08830 [Opitutaceae bacterium]
MDSARRNANPILNNPYEEPRLHYATNSAGELDYERPLEGRRPFTPEMHSVPVRVGSQSREAGLKFGTISRQAVNNATKACRRRGDADWLIFLGFSFESDIESKSVTTSQGQFQVTKVRMHDDLLQEGLLKRDKKAASFVTIGEPDVDLIHGGTRSVASADDTEAQRSSLQARPWCESRASTSTTRSRTR